MARYQAILAYDGSGFQGSQRQAKLRTVQGELEKALTRLKWNGRSVLLSGRTDAGVHASGQVTAFDLDWTHSTVALCHALNANLPPDISVRSLSLASQDFHPRFDARSRKYRYRLICDEIRDPLRENFAWRVLPPLDGNALIQNAIVFLGTHDFAAFGSPTSPKGSTIRTVTESEWRQLPDGEWQYEVRANAFLYRMVRRLVFAQVFVAQGRAAITDINGALSKQEKLAAGLAPACGLTLVEVTY